MLKLMGKVLAIIRLIAVVLCMVIFVFVYGLIVLFGLHTPARAFVMRRSFVRLCLPILGIRTELMAPPPAPNGPVLYVCNHRSLIDPVILSSYINAVILSKAEVQGYPLIGKGAEWSGVIYVQRDHQDSRTAARIAMEKAFDQGFNILVYPEGTVSGLPGTLPYRPGSFETAVGAGKPVIPVAISYRDPMRDYWTDGGLMYQYFKKFGKWRTDARVSFGPVMTPDQDGKALTNTVREWTERTLSDQQDGWVISPYPGSPRN